MADISWFNASAYNVYEPIPAGQYPAIIVQSEMRMNKAGTGEYLLLVFELIEGEHAGKRVSTRLNLKHPNPRAVEIASSKLASIMRAVGVTNPQDTSELHDTPLLIQVVVEQGQNGQDSFNEVVAFRRFVKAQPKPSPGSSSRHKLSPDNETCQAPWDA